MNFWDDFKKRRTVVIEKYVEARREVIL